MNDTHKPLVGEEAPLFSATSATGDTFDLAEKHGSYVVIWFFVRANTPG